MLHVNQILANGTVIVSAVGLCRVLAGPTNRIIGELLERDEADSMANAYSECLPDSGARVIDYAEAYQLASSSVEI